MVTAAENPEFFWPVLSQHIKGNYGHLRLDTATYDKKKKDGTITQQEKEDFECPCPFSLISYLKALMKRTFWGDKMVLMISSMMWQVGITVLTGETLRCIKFRHRNALSKADIILIRSGGNHYIPAGKCCPHFIPQQLIFVPKRLYITTQRLVFLLQRSSL